MSTGAFSIDQLMELAGLSVSQALFRLHPPRAAAATSDDGKRSKVLIACGPGNNGGDGLVAARHLAHFGYGVTLYYPKRGKAEIYARLLEQARATARVSETEDFAGALGEADAVVDAVFGFSFSGEVREPFPAVIRALAATDLPVLAVDAPSSWSIEDGPPADGPGRDYSPTALISLTAPKPLVKHFRGRHFVGGRFLTKKVADKYEIDVPPYQGSDQIVEVDVDSGKL